MQIACARAGEVLDGAPPDNGNVDPRQRQLARQHHPCQTSSGDHHRMLGYSRNPASIMPPAASASHVDDNTHFATPLLRTFWLRPALCGTTRGLQQAPRCAVYWKWNGVSTLLSTSRPLWTD